MAAATACTWEAWEQLDLKMRWNELEVALRREGVEQLTQPVESQEQC